jgi:cytochrome c biogenesis protein CcmG/thiol:disulfide interchange protein DsbE
VDQDGRVAIDWGVYGAPETFLLDAKGIVLYKHIAPLTAEVWEREFAPRIRKARGAAD